MIARAGGLDQGNLIPNVEDAEMRGFGDGVLYLAGSAINSLKGAEGRVDPALGAAAMAEALAVHRSGELRGTPPAEHVAALLGVARRDRLGALAEALRQRYPAIAA